MPGEERPSTVLALATGGNFAQLGARLLLSPLVPAIMASFEVSKSSVGLVLTGLWAVYAIFQYPGGTLGDMFDERRMLIVSLVLTTAVMGLLAASPSFLVFGLFALLLGAGTGLYFPVASSLLTRHFEGTGQALSVMTAGGAIAGAIYPALGGVLVVLVGWRTTVLLGGAVALPVIALAVFATSSPGDSADATTEWLSVQEMVGIIRRPGVPVTIGLAVLFGFTWQGIASFFPTFLYEYWQVSETVAGVAFGAFYLLSAVAQPAAGRLSDAVGRDLALFASGVLTAGGLSVLLTGESRLVLLLGVVALGTGVTWPGVVQARIMDHFGTGERGQGFGFVRAIYMLLASLGSVTVGTLADVAGWPVAYGSVVGLLSVAIVFIAGSRFREA
ncbi:MAG: MFS transporter [Halanaeroarchaeum sp.]